MLTRAGASEAGGSASAGRVTGQGSPSQGEAPGGGQRRVGVVGGVLQPVRHVLTGRGEQQDRVVVRVGLLARVGAPAAPASHAVLVPGQGVQPRGGRPGRSGADDVQPQGGGGAVVARRGAPQPVQVHLPRLGARGAARGRGVASRTGVIGAGLIDLTVFRGDGGLLCWRGGAIISRRRRRPWSPGAILKA